MLGKSLIDCDTSELFDRKNYIMSGGRPKLLYGQDYDTSLDIILSLQYLLDRPTRIFRVACNQQYIEPGTKL